MRLRCLLFFSLTLFPVATFAQNWRLFGRGAFFISYANETGPKKPENRSFSTNWLQIGAERTIAHGDGSILFRGRFTAEPLTIPSQGYPQLLQYVSPQSGGPLVDKMRAHDLVEEVAMQVGWRALRLYVAPVGEPPLGATPYAQRTSALDFAEAPFAYDVQEPFHVGTRVIVGGVTTSRFDVEGGVFHASHTTGRHSTIDDGDIDSWSARATFRFTPQLSVDASRGSLGDIKQKVSSASLTYDRPAVAVSVIWTKRDPSVAYGAEATLRAGRNAFMVRLEDVDRPAGVIYPDAQRTTHLTLGDVLDVARIRGLRAGAGVNIDYQTKTRSLESRYGHKPQTVYAFVRVRNE